MSGKEASMPRFSLLPREGRFFILFDQSAKNAALVAQNFKELMYNWQDVEQKVGCIVDLEQKSDMVAHEIIALVHKTFVTPFDREDIVLLAHSLDDVVDYIEATADTMLLYKIKSPTQRAREMADIILQTTQEVEKAISELRQRIDLKHILKHCVEINRLENMGDRIYRAALAELFDDSTDIPYIMKWREIYEHMETATDRCEDVANVIEGVAIKYS
jgi:predicted phosphate transport protein (TIGR00153 family)